jgi:succinoglycan biosynthesis protein ExoL
MTTIAYLAYNLSDAQVRRRVRLFRAAGAEVRLAGFEREGASASGAEVAPVVLGVTRNGAMAQRALAVARQVARPATVARVVAGADVVVARNLEMLAIARRVMPGRSPRPRLVYESLDIHRTLSGDGPAHRAMRALERRLLAGADLLVTSSPRFLPEHFERDAPLPIPHLLVENKVLALDAPVVPLRSTRPSAPWTVGWFGILRCRRSLDALLAAVRRSAGQMELLVAGQPSLNEMPDFHERVAATPGVRYHGAYTPADLADLYGQVHFAWAIDYMEQGQNSSWLLPNRVYEATAYGAVPIAQAGVETASWLRRNGIGVVLDSPEDDIVPFLADLTPERYGTLAGALGQVPPRNLILDRAEAEAIVARLARA